MHYEKNCLQKFGKFDLTLRIASMIFALPDWTATVVMVVTEADTSVVSIGESVPLASAILKKDLTAKNLSPVHVDDVKKMSMSRRK